MASLKTCFKCSETKPLAEFYRHPKMGDGHLGKCKQCAREDTRNNRAANADYYREYDRIRAALPHRVELRGKMFSKFKAEHPERRAAHLQVQYALRAGRLQPLPCWVCGAKAEAHHPDYSMPLDVVWLCSIHHKQAHAIARRTA